MTQEHSRIGIKTLDDVVSDTALHREIMAGVDDSEIRIWSAMKAIVDLGLTPEQAEAAFNVKLPLAE
ncbi:MAG: hypothetical protein CVU20_09360 [Betaproteobacteria bacterium HGW-Betaproteobacteria-14]|nr:MAG: hypothetical protein CVU20_09360 [Betaproteobacteria bacterium HGW-Betaproteobacteria-14]